MRVLVCGSRYWVDEFFIVDVLSKLRQDTVIIHGDCRGADKMAGLVAKRLGFVVEVYPANWKRWGGAAGPIRNELMIKDGKPDFVYAFHDNLERSKGTKDMVKRANENLIPVYHCFHITTQVKEGLSYIIRFKKIDDF